MLTLDPVVLVNVAVGASVVAASSYDVGLIVTAATQDFPTTGDTGRVKALTKLADVAEYFADSTDTYKAAAKYFGVTPAPQSLLIGVTGEGETVAQTLEAIRNKQPNWYGLYWVGASTSQIEDIDAYLNSINSGILFAGVTGTVVTIAAAAPMSTLATRKSRRTCLTYVSASTNVLEAAAVLGCAMGCAHEYAGLIWQICYKTITGMTPVSLSQEDVTTLENANFNVFVTRAYQHNLYEKGATASGMRVDEVIALDRLSNDIQEALLSLIANNPMKMPQTDVTTTRFIAAVTEVLEAYRSVGYITEGIWLGANVGNIMTGDALEHGYAIWADSFDVQTESDRRARKGMPINVALHLYGSVESIELNVTVQE